MTEEMGTQLMQQMQAVRGEMEQLTRTTVLWMVVSALLAVFLVVILVLLLRLRSKNRKLETWLTREMRTLQERVNGIQRTLVPQQRQPRSAPPERIVRTPAAPPAQPPPAQEVREAPAPRREHPREATPPREPSEPPDLIATLNEMLAGNQPYNFIEAVRALAPQLTLQRLTPSPGTDLFAKEIVLEPGGDGLFASINGNEATLYPNYSRFSATLDPSPLFSGARHGGRIHSILQPAVLTRREDGAWLLAQKGQVQMRQGN